MAKRYVAICFRHLMTDWMTRRQPELKEVPFVMAAPERGKMIVRAVNDLAQDKDIHIGMVVADCRAIHPDLMVLDYQTDKPEQLLTALAEWCIRFTPVVAIDLPDGLILDASGCAHLWNGEDAYLKDLLHKLSLFGYHVRGAMADTIGAAWAVARFGKVSPIVPPGRQLEALLPLPPFALRLERTTVERLFKLGLYQISKIARPSLKRRFGQGLLSRLDQALGMEIETITPVCPIEPYRERLPSLDPSAPLPVLKLP